MPSILITAAALVVATTWIAAPSAVRSETDRYVIQYTVTPDPETQTVAVELSLLQDRYLLREMRFTADPERVYDIRGDGRLQTSAGAITWTPPETGGRLTWTANVAQQRNGQGYDAWIEPGWGLFRAEDIVPRARTRSLRGAAGDTTMVFEIPESWSVVTEYRENNGHFPIDGRDRRFVQPSGWIVMGELGVRRDSIAGVRVAVAAPEGHGVRRLDMLAMMNWILPELSLLLPQLPSRLTVVSAGDPMWRGGLSGPRSVYIHAERPLISENGTSTLVHELVHSAFGISAHEGYDWIVEGLAEFYTLELLRRSGTLSATRFRRAVEQQASWSAEVETLCAPTSSGAQTALAVTIFNALNEEILTRSDREKSLDDVLLELVAAESNVDLAMLTRAAASASGRNPELLHIDRLPGCRTLAASEGTP